MTKDLLKAFLRRIVKKIIINRKILKINTPVSNFESGVLREIYI